MTKKYQYKKIDKKNSEKHHILPVSLFPEFSKDVNNIIIITPREHYIAHWMLAKTFGGKMWFAFNQMKRIIKYSTKNSILYEYSKKYIKKIISESNKGVKRNEEFKKNISERMKNKLLVKDEDGNVFLVHKNDERLKSGHFRIFRVGEKHTEETKNKISMNGLKNRKSYINLKTGEIKFFRKTDNIPEDFVKSPNPILKKMKTCKGRIWVFDNLYKKQLRIKKEDLNLYKDKNRYVFRRIKTKGFSKINNSGKKKYLDIINKKYVFINEGEKHNFLVKYDGSKIENIKVYIIDKTIIIGKKYFLIYLNNRKDILDFLKKKKISYYFFNKKENEILNIVGIQKQNLLDLTIKDFLYYNIYNKR